MSPVSLIEDQMLRFFKVALVEAVETWICEIFRVINSIDGRRVSAKE